MMSPHAVSLEIVPCKVEVFLPRRRVLIESELIALRDLAHCSLRQKWPAQACYDLSAVLTPVCQALAAANVVGKGRRLMLHAIIQEMHARKRACWSWTDFEWLQTINDYAEEAERKGDKRKYRFRFLTVAYLIGHFETFEHVKYFNRRGLADLAFGTEVIKAQLDDVKRKIFNLGFVDNSFSQQVYPALLSAFLMSRRPDWISLTDDVIVRLQNAGATSIRRGANRLRHVLAVHGVLVPSSKSRVRLCRSPIEGISDQWHESCDYWFAHASSALGSRKLRYHQLLRTGRWLADAYPKVTSPNQWTYDVAVQFARMVADIRIGDWTQTTSAATERVGTPLAARAKESILGGACRFFIDMWEWGLIRRAFDPTVVFVLPRRIRAEIGPNPPIIDGPVWVKLVEAGQSLGEEDMPGPGPAVRCEYTYPLPLVQAISTLWLYGGLRSGEIRKMSLNGVRWSKDLGHEGVNQCVLIVPANKGSGSYLKVIDPAVGLAIDAWRKFHNDQPPLRDVTMGGLTDYLFVHRGRLIGENFLRLRLIPLLCRKAGVAIEDSHGRITPHRARSTIASIKYNDDGWSFEDVQRWLGHDSPSSTMHYVKTSGARRRKQLRLIGYHDSETRSSSALLDR